MVGVGANVDCRPEWFASAGRRADWMLEARSVSGTQGKTSVPQAKREKHEELAMMVEGGMSVEGGDVTGMLESAGGVRRGDFVTLTCWDGWP